MCRLPVILVEEWETGRYWEREQQQQQPNLLLMLWSIYYSSTPTNMRISSTRKNGLKMLRSNQQCHHNPPQSRHRHYLTNHEERVVTGGARKQRFESPASTMQARPLSPPRARQSHLLSSIYQPKQMSPMPSSPIRKLYNIISQDQKDNEKDEQWNKSCHCKAISLLRTSQQQYCRQSPGE